MRGSSRHRPAFTLIELLVVVAIIAVLMMLLLPAIQRVREAANKSRCGSNLRQLVTAVHMYQHDHGHLPRSGTPTNPPGFPGAGSGCCSTGPSWSWIARTLPYIEQDALYNAGGIGNNAYIIDPATGARNVVLDKTINVLYCPSDNAISLRTLSNRANIGGPHGLTNYKGVSGSNWAWGTWVVSGRGASGNNTTNGLDDANGLFFRSDIRYRFRIDDVKDGTSNTFFIGEDIPERNIHCAWPYSNHANGTCAIPPNNAMIAGQPGYNNPGDWNHVYSFRSNHTGGVQFAFGDSGVRFIKDSIDINIYRALATHRGEEVVNLADLF